MNTKNFRCPTCGQDEYIVTLESTNEDNFDEVTIRCRFCGISGPVAQFTPGVKKERKERQKKTKK